MHPIADRGNVGAEFDDYAPNYHEKIDHLCRRLVDPSGDYFVRLKCDEILSIAAKLESNGKDLLAVDVGCGTGDFERILAGRLGRVIGFDLSPRMLQVAAGQPQGSFFCADACFIALPDSTADLVFASCIFHHMPGVLMAPALREMRRVCKAGGYVVIFEHNPLNPLTQLVIRTTPLDRSAILFPSWTVRKAIQRAGLLVAVESFILFAPEMIDRRLGPLKRWLSAIPLGGQYMVVGQKRDDD